MSEELDSQLSVIRAGQWQEVVFTTYALSLTFFESCLLPALRHARCEKATIFVDLDGYRASLMERRSASAGREYAVVPIQVVGGIFHPKCSYFYGDERDALLIGSGNLTFGGHGKNVEVLEVLFSDAHPECFLQFADFVSSILARRNVYIAEKATLERLAQRARHAGRRETARLAGAIEILHSTDQSIYDQLRARWPSAGAVKQVLVLSPYHHPTGEPIRALVKDTGARELLVGVPSDGSTTSFPLAEVKGWGIDVQCVRPNVSNRKRGLHAKWWELRGQKETLTLTGSINATLESFSTTYNIEVGVLRRLRKPLADVWDDVRPPDYEKDAFHRGDSSGIGAIYATVNGEGHVRGCLLGIATPSGEWAVQIEDSSTEDRRVPVSPDGTFAWRDLKLVTASRTLQVEMHRGAVIARGWLSNEAVLRMPSRSRAVAQAVVRMLMREETVDDIEAMFDYIATETAAALAEAPTRESHLALSRQGPAENEVIERIELDYAGSSAEQRLLQGLSKDASNPAHRLSILDSIAAILLGHASNASRSRKGAQEPKHHRRGEESEDEEESAANIARQDALDRFNDAMESQLEHANVVGRQLGIAMRIWLNVNLDMQLRRIGSPEAVWLHARKWVGHVLQTRLDDESRAMLAESFCGLVAGLLARTAKLRGAETAVSDVAVTPRVAHDWLDRFFGGTSSSERVSEYVAGWMDHDLAQLMVEGDSDAVMEAANMALKTPTARQILTDVVVAHAAGRRIELPTGLFSDEVAKQLEYVQRATKDRPIHRVVKGARPVSCQKCYVTLIADTLARLRVNRVAECMNCHTIIIWLGRDDEAR
jgi:hypothetical protein